MRTFAIILTIFLTVGCAKNSAFTIKNESSSKTAKVNNKKVDNRVERYKIMNDEIEITKSKSYKRMLKYTASIKTKLDKCFAVIERYRKRSDDEGYQKHIAYVNCTYVSIAASYDYMESFIKKEQEKQTIKDLNEFKDKLRSNASKLLMKDMEKCEKIR